MTACFSYQGHLLLELIQVPVLLPLPSVFGTTLEGGRERLQCIRPRGYHPKPPQEVSGKIHMLVVTLCPAIYIHSHILEHQRQHNRFCVCCFIPSTIGRPLTAYGKETIFSLIVLFPHLFVRAGGCVCISQTVGRMARGGNHLLLSVSS